MNDAIKKDEKRGTYYFVISAGYHPDGRRRQIKRRGFKSKQEARLAMVKIQNEIINDEYVQKSSETVNDFLKIYLDRKKIRVARTTYERYERYINNHIRPRLGEHNIQKVTQLMIQNFVDNMFIETQCSTKQCRGTISILKEVFKIAAQSKAINDNPVFEIDIPKKDQKQMVVWSVEEIQKFIDLRTKSNKGRYYTAILLGLLTGMRKGEILGLTWDKIDFENQLISIDQIYDGKNIEQRTKTKAGRRKVSISKLLCAELKKEKQKRAEEKLKSPTQYNEDNLVFCTKKGKPLLPADLNKAFDKMINKFGFTKITIHELRHTHATLLINDNVNIKVIQDRLGHVDISTTLNIYSHVLPSHRKEVADRLDDLFCDQNVTTAN